MSLEISLHKTKQKIQFFNQIRFQFTCLTNLPCENDSIALNNSHRRCFLPQYISLAAAFAFLCLSVFLRYLPCTNDHSFEKIIVFTLKNRLPFLIKTILIILMGIVYSLYIQLSHIEIFTCYDERVSSSIPQHTITLLRIALFMIAVLTHGRQVEWTARLDFLWQLQASHEKREMAVLQESNRRILFNLLPAHVAIHFLDNQFRGTGNTMGQDLYYQSYSKVGVMFCSIPNFHEFYTELDGNQLGVECLRLLNEIIADFDNLLAQERFVAIDKIKTIGSTYMASVGLFPNYKMINNDVHSIRRHMTSLLEFARAMRASIQNINENSYNNFVTRIGKKKMKISTI